MTALLRFIPMLAPVIAWFAARGGYVVTFIAGVGIAILTIMPLAKDRAYDAGRAAGMTQASAEHAAAIARARTTHDDRTARQIEDRINAESIARHPAAADGVRDCGPAVRGCPARDGSPR